MSVARKVSSIAIAVLVGYGVACSKDESKYVDEEVPAADAGFDTKPAPDSGLGILAFMPHESYSGHDGAHTFTVPVAVYDSGDDLVVTASDVSAAEIAPKKLLVTTREDGSTDNGKYFFVTVKRPGVITLTATSRGKSVDAAITVTSYDPNRWATGQKRYTEGGGGDPPCTDCHVNGQAVDHSPAALATATDEEIGIVITTGINTSGFPIQFDGKPGHTWTVTDAERDGLVTYLRSLTPRGFQ